MKCIFCEKEQDGGIVFKDKFVCNRCRQYTDYDFDYSEVEKIITKQIKEVIEKEQKLSEAVTK